jgi:hypothetical protein
MADSSDSSLSGNSDDRVARPCWVNAYRQCSEVSRFWGWCLGAASDLPWPHDERAWSARAGKGGTKGAAPMRGPSTFESDARLQRDGGRRHGIDKSIGVRARENVVAKGNDAKQVEDGRHDGG